MTSGTGLSLGPGSAQLSSIRQADSLPMGGSHNSASPSTRLPGGDGQPVHESLLQARHRPARVKVTNIFGRNICYGPLYKPFRLSASCQLLRKLNTPLSVVAAMTTEGAPTLAAPRRRARRIP